MEQHPFGWCFVGTGTLAKNVAKEILPSGGHRIVATYSRNAERNQAFAARYGAVACATLDEAILADGVDAVYVVTPHPAHYACVKRALELGKPVLCEKPFTVTAREAEELFALSKEKQLYLAEAMWTWFAPTAHRVKQWVDAGRFGTITYAKANYHLNSAGYAQRVTDPNQAGGALLDIGVYPIHYLYRLFGKPKQIVCIGRVRDGIDWGEEVTMTFENGLTALASVSLDDSKGLERYIIRGTAAKTSIFLAHMANGAKLKSGLRTLDSVKGYGGMRNEFDRVAEEIRAGKRESTFVPHAATRDVMEIMDECRRQMGLAYPFEKA